MGRRAEGGGRGARGGGVGQVYRVHRGWDRGWDGCCRWWGSEWAGLARCHDAEDLGRRLWAILALAFQYVFVPEREEKG